LSEALSILGTLEDRLVVAGGTDLYAQLEQFTPKQPLLDISNLAELKGISRNEQVVRIGAATTWNAISQLETTSCSTALVEAARLIGNRQIQARATIGGNICNASPAADGIPPLLVSGARLEIQSKTLTRLTTIDDFLRTPRETRLARGELLTAVLLPECTPSTVSAFEKIGVRQYNALSIVMAAVGVQFDQRKPSRIRIAVGAAAPSARRLYVLEHRLEDRPELLSQTPVTLSDLSELSPVDDVRSTAKYRLAATRSMLNRLLARVVMAKEHIA
jgi:CO/xanthine dehydrogenase FAD-binding subunit